MDTKQIIARLNRPYRLITNPSEERIQALYESEAFCIEGFDFTDKESMRTLWEQAISKWPGRPKKVKMYGALGKDINEYYHLTDDNAYKDDLHFLLIRWDDFSNEFQPVAVYKGDASNMRCFTDVVDNNARVEIRKDNPYYKNYHSLYGNKWFYSTI